METHPAPTPLPSARIPGPGPGWISRDRRSRWGRAALAGLVVAGLAACGTSEAASVKDRPAKGRPAHQADARPVTYVALGDSYTAAPKTAESAGGPAGCIRSAEDYPHRVAEAIDADHFVDASCTGATTDDLFGPQALDEGGTNAPQLDAVTKDTTVVTVGIGGNDLGFADVITGCLAPSPDAAPCRTALEGDGPTSIEARLDHTAPKIAKVLADVHERAPRAKVFVVGYPTIFPERGGCFDVVKMTDGDAAFLHTAEDRLNAMLKTVAQRSGATFVDTAKDGHDACAGQGRAFIEGLAPRTPAMPFHPNQEGAAHQADRVAAAVEAAD